MASRKLERRPSLLSKEDVDKLYHSFLRIDKSGKGVIDRAELMTIPAIASNPLAGRLLDLFDADCSGTIDFAEFVRGLAIFSAKASQHVKLRFAFDLYDMDRDGYIANGELYLTLRIMVGDQLQPRQLQQVVDKTIRDADLDGDGRISFPEFCRIIERGNADFLTKWSFADL